MRVWPVLLILMTACGTSVSTSPAEPTSDDQVITEPDAEPAETAVEAAAARPDVGRDSGADAPREASPDVAAPDVAMDTADTTLDAPEAWVWRPRDVEREAEAEVSPPEPLVVPVDFRYGDFGTVNHADCPGWTGRDVATVDVVLPSRFSVATFELDVAFKNCTFTYGTVPVCGNWTVNGVSSFGISFDPIETNNTPIESARRVSANIQTYGKFSAGDRVAFYLAQECGQAHYTGTVTFR